MGEHLTPARNPVVPRLDDLLDAGLAAAFAPNAAVPIPGASVLSVLLSSMLEVPRVQLRDQDEEQLASLIARATPALEPKNGLPDGAGRYQFLGEIARGGMGAIFKGHDVDLGRDVAVKVLKESYCCRTGPVQRFIEEAQIAGQLQHPGIVPVYELGVFADRRPFFTMKLVQGETLAALLERRKVVSEDRAKFLGIFEQVCQTLAYAHARGVIHRDLKPSNVMVGSFGEVQVMDWGLAKVLKRGGIADELKADQEYRRHWTDTEKINHTVDDPEEQSSVEVRSAANPATEAGSILGTPAFMAPEQARGAIEETDERADVFGLGAIVCEILTGHPPFTGPKDEIRRKARLGEIGEAHARLDACGTDAEIIAIAKRCLAAEPRDRPRNAGEVAAAMTDYQRSLTQRLRQAELDRAAAEARATVERKRRLATIGLAVALSALLLGGGGAAAWWWHDRTSLSRDVEAALAEASRHQNANRWPEARAALARAAGRLGESGPAALRQRVQQGLADATMVGQLEETRLHRSEGNRSADENAAAADHWYADAFANYAIPLATLSPDEAAHLVRNSGIRETLVSFLHDWLYWAPPRDHDLVSAVVELADDSGWRQAFRKSLADKNVNRMRELAQEPEAQSQPPVVTCCLADALSKRGQEREGIALLRKMQRQHPADFWTNHLLALFLWRTLPAEALGYGRVAVALRPTSGEAQAIVGKCLLGLKDVEGALVAFRMSQRLDPDRNIGLDLAYALESRGRLKEVQEVWQNVLEITPPDFDAWFGYGELCLYLRKEDAYRRTCRELLNRFADAQDPLTLERIGRLCFLVRPMAQDLDRAQAMVNRAALSCPEYLHPFVQFAQGLAEYRLNRAERALPLLSAASEKMPYPTARLALAMAQYRLGLKKEADASFAKAIQGYDWRMPPSRIDWWVAHILRREAEALVRSEGERRGARSPEP